MSLKSKIYEFLKAEYPRIVHKGEIGRKAVLEWGYENENAGRRCRELENEGRIKAFYENNQVSYQWLPEMVKTSVIGKVKINDGSLKQSSFLVGKPYYKD